MLTHTKFSLGSTYSYLFAAKLKLEESLSLMKGHQKSLLTLIRAYELCCDAIHIITKIRGDQTNKIIIDLLLEIHLHALRVAVNLAEHDKTLTARVYTHAEFIKKHIPAADVFKNPVRAMQSACALITLSQRDPKSKDSEETLFTGCRNLNYHFATKNLVQKSEALDEQQTTQLIFCLSQLVRTFHLKSRMNQAQLYAGMLMTLLARHMSSHWHELNDFLPDFHYESNELNAAQARLKQAAVAHADAAMLTLLTLEQSPFAANTASLQLLRHFQEHICLYGSISAPLNYIMLNLEQSRRFANLNVMCLSQREFKIRETPRVVVLDEDDTPDEENTVTSTRARTALQLYRAIGNGKNEREQDTKQDKAERKAAGDIIRKKHRH